jgi:hypothetical protein
MKIGAMATAVLTVGTILPRPALAGTYADVAFKKLQALSGEWEGKDGKGKPAKTSFKVIVSNTGVLETLSPGDMEQMVTVYSMDGDGIALIHFCPTNNQPRMRAAPTSDDVKELVFDFQSAGNLPSPNAGHQHHLVIRFEDADHFTEAWTWRENGMDMPMVFHFSRKKK